VKTRILVVAIAVAALLGGGVALLWPGQDVAVLVEDARIVLTEDVPAHGAAYLKLSNPSDDAVVLTGAETDIAVAARLRIAGHGGGMIGDGSMDMRDMDHAGMEMGDTDGPATVAVPARGEALLTPETVFIELSGIDRALQVGEIVPLTLSFDPGGALPIRARVDAVVPPGMLMIHGGLFIPPTGEPSPTLALRAEARADRRVALTLETTDFTFDEDGADGPHVPGHGHGHLYIDTVKIGRVYDTTYVTEPLEPGTRVLSVTLNTNDHRSYGRAGGTVTATIAVTVE
jgi:copper(I)-binding protein